VTPDAGVAASNAAPAARHNVNRSSATPVTVEPGRASRIRDPSALVGRIGASWTCASATCVLAIDGTGPLAWVGAGTGFPSGRPFPRRSNAPASVGAAGGDRTGA